MSYAGINPTILYVPLKPEPGLSGPPVLTGILNASTIASAIAAYAAQLSLGTSVIENLKLPTFNPDDEKHEEIARLAGIMTDENGIGTDELLNRLNELAYDVVSKHS